MAESTPAVLERGAVTLRRQQRLRHLAAVLFGTLLALALVEGLLRLFGHQAFHFVPRADKRPVFNEPDPVLGWRSKPGTYSIPRKDQPLAPRRVTILPDGSRATGTDATPSALVLLGCSFTFGEGVSDQDTYAWKLGEHLPGRGVRNFGTIGYGTYQSLLLLERLLARGERPAWVLYGYMDNHEIRNVAHPLWTFWLLNFSRSGLVAVPSVRLDAAGGLRRDPPRSFPLWPLQDRLAVVNLLAQAFLKREVQAVGDESSLVTERLIQQIAELCRQHGIHFGIVFLAAPDENKQRYTRALAATDARVIDCTAALTPERQIPHDGHPTEEAHAEYARCIADALGDEIR
jgi:hypothetical protein